MEQKTVSLKSAYGKKIWVFWIIVSLTLCIRIEMIIDFMLNIGYSAGWGASNFLAKGILPAIANLPFSIYELFGLLGSGYAVAFITLIFGLLSVLYYYKMIFVLFRNEGASFFAALLLFISLPHIYLSANGSHGILVFLLFVMSLYYGSMSLLDESKRGSMGISALLFAIAALSNYLLIFYWPFLITIAYIKNKKDCAIFGLSALPIILFFISSPVEIDNFGRILSLENSISLSSILYSLSMYLLIPIVLLITAFDYRFRINLSKNFLYAFIILALPAIILSSGFSHYSMMNYALIFILAPGALLLKQFSFMGSQFRKTTMIIIGAMLFFTFYQLYL